MRYRERVEAVCYAEVRARLTVPVILLASEVGAPFVRLAGGQRVVIKDDTVVTVLPADIHPSKLARPG